MIFSMETFYRSFDGKEFLSYHECKKYEERLHWLINAFIEVGLTEKIQGTWISEKIGISRRLMPHIHLMDSNLEIICRREGAQHLAEFMDEYIALGKWLESLLFQESEKLSYDCEDSQRHDIKPLP